MIFVNLVLNTDLHLSDHSYRSRRGGVNQIQPMEKTMCIKCLNDISSVISLSSSAFDKKKQEESSLNLQFFYFT